VTVKEASAVEELAETVNDDVAELLPVTVAGGGVAQDGAGWFIPETVHVKSILPVKPLKGMTVIVEVATPELRVAGVRGDSVTL